LEGTGFGSLWVASDVRFFALGVRHFGQSWLDLLSLLRRSCFVALTERLNGAIQGHADDGYHRLFLTYALSSNHDGHAIVHTAEEATHRALMRGDEELVHCARERLRRLRGPADLIVEEAPRVGSE
jgi:hypothetical protein